MNTNNNNNWKPGLQKAREYWKSHPEMHARRVEIVRQYFAQHPEESERLKKQAQDYHSLLRRNPELKALHRQKQSEGNTPEVSLRRSKEKAGKAMTGRASRGEQNWRSLFWSLRDPSGVPHQFVNLFNFVRTHPELFAAEDVVWRPLPKKKGAGFLSVYCRAVRGIGNLRPERKYPRLSWKGWTWFSIPERRFNDGEDLLQRRLKPQN
jgi:hypothetical protein